MKDPRLVGEFSFFTKVVKEDDNSGGGERETGTEDQSVPAIIVRTNGAVRHTVELTPQPRV